MRVVPSEVVGFIDGTIPAAAARKDHFVLDIGHLNPLQGLVDLLERLPDELITLEGPALTRFLANVSSIEAAVATWKAGNTRHILGNIPGFTDVNPVVVVRSGLSECPDEAPARNVSALAFMSSDPALRESLRLDLTAIETSLTDRSFKAATVLAGSVVEALLLWALQRVEDVKRNLAEEKLKREGKLRSKVSLEDMGLGEYIILAAELVLLESNTVIQARLAQDFRNLIHPGRSVRLGQVCDRATALSAVAAVEHVVRDLTTRSLLKKSLSGDSVEGS